VKTVLIPEENVKDLQDIPENAKNNLEIVPVKWIDQVLEIALESMPTPLPDDDLPVQAVVAVEPTSTATPGVKAVSADGLPH
jgi:ATP-dependent Lon protease